MKIDVLTLFPSLFDTFKEWSIIGRAIEKEIFSLHTINIRDFADNKHKQVDDYPFGGGPGMIMKAEPIYKSILSTKTKDSRVIYLSPQGRVYNQKLAKRLAKEKHLILLCGHYEGVDNRIIDNYVDMEISIGDYVLTGGEVPALVLIESVIRLLPGVLGNQESHKNESHYKGILEHSQYTRPRVFNGLGVPDVLLSGDHKRINEWQKYSAIRNTYVKRPDLLEKMILSNAQGEILKSIKEEIEDKN